MDLPKPRGELSRLVLEALHGGTAPPAAATCAVAAADDDDLHLTLWVLYELHYRGFADVDDRREWDPALIGLRRDLEVRVESELRSACASVAALADDAESVPDKLAAIASYDTGTSLPAYLHRDATADQFCEFLMQRSLYHLKESDPHAWALPRLDGRAKVALAELLYDEYGAGVPERLHSRLFADALEAVGLDASYGVYVDRVPSYTFAVNNAMSMLGLNRRLRGAAMGHLAAFEMTSSLPCRRYLQGASRLDLPDAVGRYFDEHVEADAVHEHLAARDICGALVDAEPDLLADVLLGAAVCVHLDAVAGERMVDAWTHGRSTLRPEPGEEVA